MADKRPDKSPSRAGQATRSRNNKLARMKRADNGLPKQEWPIVGKFPVHPRKASRMSRRIAARS